MMKITLKKIQWFPPEHRNDLNKHDEWGLNYVLRQHNAPFEPLVTESNLSFLVKDCITACGSLLW